MRTGAAAGQTGYFHEALCFATDEELLAAAVPFLRDGVAEGEPTVVALGEHNADLIRGALPDHDAGKVVFHPGGDMYARPASAIRSYRAMLTDYAKAGAHQIRIVGEVPPLGTTWDWWARYESAINHAYDDFPLWSMCAYDTRTTPAAVLTDVWRTHPRVVGSDGQHLENQSYSEPAQFLRERAEVTLDPLQLTPPQVEQEDAAPSEIRAAITRLNETVPGGILSREKLGDLQIAATEAVANGLTHGRPPVAVKCWAAADRIVVTVTDRGEGPTDPFAGLQAAAHAPNGGFGLWLAHQLCDHVAMRHDDEGFTLRLISGNPHHRVEDQPPTRATPARRLRRPSIWDTHRLTNG